MNECKLQSEWEYVERNVLDERKKERSLFFLINQSIM